MSRKAEREEVVGPRRAGMAVPAEEEDDAAAAVAAHAIDENEEVGSSAPIEGRRDGAERRQGRTRDGSAT